MHRLFIWSSLVFSATVTGCASHSLRSGIWELTYRVERIQNRTALPIQTREVRVDVEWAADQRVALKNPRAQEVVEISPVIARSTQDPESRLPRHGMRSMYGEIEVHGEHMILMVPPHPEKDWVWQLTGLVETPEYVKGTRFDARIQRIDNAEFEGSWSMQWLRDE